MENSLEQHYATTMGAPPRQIDLMRALDEDFAQRYVALREVFYRDRPSGLNSAEKELLFLALSVAAGNMNGVRNHVRPARQAGVSTRQMAETLMAVMLVDGVGSWGASGAEAWEAWLGVIAEDESTAKGADTGSAT